MNSFTTIAKSICNDGMVCEFIYAGLVAMLVFSVPVMIFTGI